MEIERTLSKEEVEKVVVVVLRGDLDSFERIAGFPEDCICILLREKETMEFLDEADMGRNGWVRSKVSELSPQDEPSSQGLLRTDD